jgi:hypothetical protein
MAVALDFDWPFLAAADFLDPPPCRRSEEDFIGRQTSAGLMQPH